MSNFPFNNDKYEYSEEINGSPLTFSEAEHFAYKIMMWHSRKETSDWTQSNDGFDSAVRDFAFGLIELLSDPNAVKRLEQTGEKVRETVEFMMDSKDDGHSQRWMNVKKYLNDEFNK